MNKSSISVSSLQTVPLKKSPFNDLKLCEQYLPTLTEDFDFVDREETKVGDDTTAEARRVIQPNQVTQK